MQQSLIFYGSIFQHHILTEHLPDGLFGSKTEEALRGYQRRTSLAVDGVCGCNSWKKISTAVLGVGRTRTTID